MICEINDKKSFHVDDASHLEDKFDSGTPIMLTGSYRAARQCSQFLFNEMGLVANHSCISGDVPYVLVLHGARNNSKPSAANIKAARAICKAFCVGLESHYLFNLD